MELTWYSLRLMEEGPAGYACNTPRHLDQDIDALWVEQLLNLTLHLAHRVWFTCDECHVMMQIVQSQEE